MANNFTDDINLEDELSAPTIEREVQQSEFEQKGIPFKVDDFNTIEQSPDEEESYSEITVNKKEYDKLYPPTPKVSPEDSADSIIDMLDVATSTIFIPLIGKKLKNKFGANVMVAAKDALLKELADPENLSDDEKLLISKFKQFKAIMKETSEAIPFSDEEIRKLRPSTIRLCEKHGIQVNENVAFGANIIKVLGTRIVDIVTL